MAYTQVWLIHKSLQYIEKIVREMGGSVTANFLDKCADGDYQLKKEPEVEQELIFMQDLNVIWRGAAISMLKTKKKSTPD